MKMLLALCTVPLVLDASYTVKNQMVYDQQTTLVWEEASSVEAMSWEGALQYCSSLGLDGQSDWRLPNRKELETIVSYEHSNPSIDTTFGDTLPDSYWTSTTRAGYLGQAWTVNFYAGYAQPTEKDQTHYVRCVRGGVTD